MKAGVGVPGVPVNFDRRSVPEREWRGFYAELNGNTVEALRNAWKADAWGTKAQYSGEPTQSEIDYTIVYEHRTGSFYRQYFWEFQVGGTAANPLIITEKNIKYYIGDLNIRPEWKLGLFSYVNFFGWVTWVDNRLPASHPANKNLNLPKDPPVIDPPDEPEDPPVEEPEPIAEDLEFIKETLINLNVLVESIETYLQGR